MSERDRRERAGPARTRPDRLCQGRHRDLCRAPVGKIGEEFIGYMTGPLDMMRKKLGTIARPAGRSCRTTPVSAARSTTRTPTPRPNTCKTLYLIAAPAKSQTPEGQIGAFSDLVKGEGDAKVNALQAFGPFAGVTFSKGAPGRPGRRRDVRLAAQHEFKVNQALPDIRKQILRGDIDGAIGRMTELDIPRAAAVLHQDDAEPRHPTQPAGAVRDFYLHATPEQRDRFERAQQASKYWWR
jgi:hypothetical protein